MTKKRMETADEEFMAASLDVIERAHAQGKPFFVWHNSTRMHVWTHLKGEALGRTGIGLYPDGMVEHDDQVGTLLDKLDELGIADNTIVIYSTDNGAETVTWPDGGTTPFHGEKGTTWEGGFRVLLIVKWPGVFKPGAKYSDIISHEDWMPTLAAAVGEPDLVEKLKAGHVMNGKEWRVHLDGHNFLPYFTGEMEKGPRDSIFYFDQPGNVNALRWNDWKLHFAVLEGDITAALRFEPSWPLLINLRADPYERGAMESKMYLRWYVPNMWTFVPMQQKVQEFLASLEGYPFQEGSSLSAAGINYNSLKMQKLIKSMGKGGGK